MHILKLVTSTEIILEKLNFSFWGYTLPFDVQIFCSPYMFLSAYECVNICDHQGSQPSNETPLGMGATLDIQRQQRMDLLDQQLLLAQYNETSRNARHQRQVDGRTHNYCPTDEQTNSTNTHDVRTSDTSNCSCTNCTSSIYVQST